MQRRRQPAAFNDRAFAIAIEKVEFVEIADLVRDAQPLQRGRSDWCSSASSRAGTRPVFCPVCAVDKRRSPPTEHGTLLD